MNTGRLLVDQARIDAAARVMQVTYVEQLAAQERAYAAGDLAQQAARIAADAQHAHDEARAAWRRAIRGRDDLPGGDGQ